MGVNCCRHTAGIAAIDRVVIINDLSEARGGATAIALESLRLLEEQGIETAFISGDDGAGLVGKVSKLEALGSVHISRDRAQSFDLERSL